MESMNLAKKYKTKLIKISVGRYGMEYYSKLTPTGRWKIKYNPKTNESVLFIEHKGLLWNSWIHENNIKEIVIEEEFINEC